MSNIVLALAILSILIACLGVYGLTAFTTSRRTREVGIRKVMGAGYYQIVKVFTREYLWLILIANCHKKNASTVEETSQSIRTAPSPRKLAMAQLRPLSSTWR